MSFIILLDVMPLFQCYPSLSCDHYYFSVFIKWCVVLVDVLKRSSKIG